MEPAGESLYHCIFPEIRRVVKIYEWYGESRRTVEMNCKMLNERKSIRLFYFITKFYNEYFDEYM